MPTVPSYNASPVEVQGLKIQPEQADGNAESFGAGEASQKPFDAASTIGQTIERIGGQERQNADSLMVMDADRQLSAFETSLLHDPQTGALSVQGKNALGLPEQVNDAYSKQVDQITNSLQNQDQKDAFLRAATTRIGDVNKTVSAHVAQQIQQYDNETTKSYIANERDAAIQNFQDTDRIDMSIARQQGALQDFAKRTGKPQEWIDQAQDEAASETHKGVISKLLANDQDITAKNYYDENKEDISGSDQIYLDKALEEGSLRGESQRRSDQIMEDADNRTDALDQAKEITDPKLRDETERRINQAYSQQKQAQEEAQQDLYLSSTNLLDKNPGKSARDVIPPDTWTQLSLSQRNALENYVQAPGNDDQAWLKFLDLGKDDIGSLSKAEFETDYWSKFDSAHRNRAETMWEASKNAANKESADPKLASTLSFKDLVKNGLVTSGLIPANQQWSKLSADQASLVSNFEAKANLKLQEFQAVEGKKATSADMQKVIDGMLRQQITIDPGFFSRNKTLPASIVSPEDAAKAFVPMAKIPPRSVSTIQNLAKSYGKNPTNDKVQRAYAASLLGDDARVESILKE